MTTKLFLKSRSACASPSAPCRHLGFRPTETSGPFVTGAVSLAAMYPCGQRPMCVSVAALHAQHDQG